MQNEQEEIWKDIPGYEGLYQISNSGLIKTLKKNKEYLKKGIENSRGYLQFRLIGNNKKTVKLHRLVALAFIPNPENKPCVNHINGIKTDNRVENLEWVTHKENQIHAVKNNLINSPKGIKNINSKLDDEKVINIIKSELSDKELAFIYGVNRQSINSIRNRNGNFDYTRR